MTTKFDVGQDVLIKAKVKHINVYEDNRASYDVIVCGIRLNNVSEGNLVSNMTEEALQYDICPTNEDSGAIAF